MGARQFLILFIVVVITSVFKEKIKSGTRINIRSHIDIKDGILVFNKTFQEVSTCYRMEMN